MCMIFKSFIYPELARCEILWRILLHASMSAEFGHCRQLHPMPAVVSSIQYCSIFDMLYTDLAESDLPYTLAITGDGVESYKGKRVLILGECATPFLWCFSTSNGHVGVTMCFFFHKVMH